MDTIRLMDVVKGTSTNNDGSILKHKLQPFFDRNEPVILSFDEALSMSSSFFNSSFGELINEYGIDKFRNIVFPRKIKRNHLNLIRKYIDTHLRCLNEFVIC